MKRFNRTSCFGHSALNSCQFETVGGSGHKFSLQSQLIRHLALIASHSCRTTLLKFGIAAYQFDRRHHLSPQVQKYAGHGMQWQCSVSGGAPSDTQINTTSKD
jgi:hypothetical protein